MAKRSTDLQNVDFHLELLRHIPQYRKTTAKELQQILAEQGIAKDLRTVQRALKKLSDRGDIECDDRAMPYGYRQCSHQQRRHLITPEVAVFLKCAADKLGKVLPDNIMKSVSPMLEDADYVLQHSQRALVQRAFLSNFNYLPTDDFPYLAQYKAIVSALSQQRQVEIINWKDMSLNVSPIEIFEQYFIAYIKNVPLFPIPYAQIKQARMLTLSADIPPENHRTSTYFESLELSATHFDVPMRMLSPEPVTNIKGDYPMVYQDLNVINHQSAVILCVQGVQSRAFVQSLNLEQTEDFHIHYGAISQLNVNPGSCAGIIYLADDISLEDRQEIAQKVKNVDSHLIFSLTPTRLSNSDLRVISQHNKHQLQQLFKLIHSSITQAGLIQIGVDSFQEVLNEHQALSFVSAKAAGENRAKIATEQALTSLLSQGIQLPDVEFMLVVIHAGMDLTLEEFATVGEVIQPPKDDKKNIPEHSVIIGSTLDFMAEGAVEIKLLVGCAA